MSLSCFLIPLLINVIRCTRHYLSSGVNIITSIGTILIAFVLTFLRVTASARFFFFLQKKGNWPDMRALKGKCWAVFLATVLVGLDGCLSVEAGFTMQDLEVIRNLTQRLRTKSVVFVEDSQDVTLVNGLKGFSGRQMYHTVINSSILSGILERNESRLSFFQWRTAIVTREHLKLALLLGEVSAPHYLTWIVFRDYNLFPNLYIPVSNQVIFINSSSESISATQIYHPKPKKTPAIQSFPLERSAGEYIQLKNVNFQNVTMDMLILNQKKNCPKINSTLSKLECAHQYMLELISLRLNFSINIVECLEKEYPFTYPNGSESVLFLKLRHREIDFSAISHVVLRNKSRYYMDLVWPTFVLKSRMYLKQGRLSGRWLTYLRPLESSVWWGILIWILSTGFLIHIFDKLLKKELKFSVSFVLDLIKSTLNALQVFCNQALAEIPTASSIRIIYFLKFFVVLIFFQAYCGYLISSITVVIPHYPFRDLKGFFENPRYRIMALQRGFHQFYFRKIIGEGRKADFMLPQDDLPNTIQQAVDRLCNQRYLAFVEFREDLLNYERLNCRLAELPTPTVSLYIGIAFPRNMPLKELFRRELLHLRSTGLIKRLSSRLSSHSDFREKNSQNEYSSVRIRQIFSIFVFHWIGVGLSIIILLIELTLYKWTSSRDGEKRMRKGRRIFVHSCHSLNSSSVTAPNNIPRRMMTPY